MANTTTAKTNTTGTDADAKRKRATVADVQAQVDALLAAQKQLREDITQLTRVITPLAREAQERGLAPDAREAVEAGKDVAAVLEGKPKRKGKLTKAASRDVRETLGASNSAKYVCSCVAASTGQNAWGVTDAFRAKHEGKGHTVTQIRD